MKVLFSLFACFFVFCVQLKAEDDCSTLPYCAAIGGTDCGWCWDTNSGAKGTIFGPSEGKCYDWTWFHSRCQNHINCTALPDCLNILGTDCGWCMDTKTAIKGTVSGPVYGDCKDWLWYHTSCPVTYHPEQVHISYSGSANEMVFTWATTLQSDDNYVYYKLSTATDFKKVLGNTTQFTDANPKGKQYIHRATLNDLIPGKQYTYYITVGSGSDVNKTAMFNFTAMRNDSEFVPHFLVFGDMGRYGGAPSLQLLIDEVKTGWPDVAIHVGDFAYDLITDSGINGDNFLNRIQPIAATIPYMTCPGNHEEHENFAHYRNRFSMPRSYVNDGLDMWHSWNIQKIHFISYSTEVYFFRPQDIDRQLAWLKADLEDANLPQNRKQRPWVIAYGHRPMYCSNSDGDDCTKKDSKVRASLEQLFHEGGVDVVIEGHEHSYERLYPTYNWTYIEKSYVDPKAMVHIVSGAAGCNEQDGDCINPMSGDPQPWSAYRAYKKGTYGFGHMVVVNDTHLYFHELVDETDKDEDEVWIVQHNHGPRTN